MSQYKTNVLPILNHTVGGLVDPVPFFLLSQHVYIISKYETFFVQLTQSPGM